MIVGIGTDLVSIQRIQRLMLNPRFVQRILTPRERSITPLTPEYVAGRWAAKEATYKAIGDVQWQDLEVVSSPNPTITLLKEHPRGPLSLFLSISHEREMALAFVVATSCEADGR